MNPNRHLDGISRRIFMAQAARSCLGVSLVPFLGASGSVLAAEPSGGKAKRVIYLFMSGGMTHLDTFDPKPGSETQGPTKAIATKAQGMQLSEHLPQLAQRGNKITVVRGMTSTQGAHGPGRYLARTSYSPRATIKHPGMGAWAVKMKGRGNRRMPGSVVISTGSDHPGAGFMDLRYGPLPIGDPNAGLKNSKLLGGVSEKDFERRLSLVAQFGTQFFERYPHKKVKGYGEIYADAIKIMQSEDIQTFDLNKEDKATRDRFGRGRFGQGLLLARRLVEQDVRYVEVELGGWDTHNDNFNRLTDKGPEMDKGVSALLDDLESKGLLDETLVVLTSEFGRSPKINDTVGRDHHPAAFSSMLAGGGIRGGYVHGNSDERGHYVEDGEVTIPDLNATIATALGIPIDKVVESASRRPFTVAHEGEPVEDVFA